MAISYKTLEVELGQSASNIVVIGQDSSVANIYIPDNFEGTELQFWADLGNGVLRPFNFSFDLTKTENSYLQLGDNESVLLLGDGVSKLIINEPIDSYRGRIISDLTAMFKGIARLQLRLDQAQSQKVTFLVGLTY